MTKKPRRIKHEFNHALSKISAVEIQKRMSRRVEEHGQKVFKIILGKKIKQGKVNIWKYDESNPLLDRKGRKHSIMVGRPQPKKNTTAPTSLHKERRPSIGKSASRLSASVVGCCCRGCLVPWFSKENATEFGGFLAGHESVYNVHVVCWVIKWDSILHTRAQLRATQPPPPPPLPLKKKSTCQTHPENELRKKTSHTGVHVAGNTEGAPELIGAASTGIRLTVTRGLGCSSVDPPAL